MGNTDLKSIILDGKLNKDIIIKWLESSKENSKILYQHANKIKQESITNTVYFRGLIEFSNICSKNCYYCGIRKDNSKVERYNISDDDILDAAKFAHENKYGSIVLQGGERSDQNFIDRIDTLLQKIKKQTNNELGITLSVGEQTKETYQRWFDSGAHRYLLRIESSNEDLYYKLHPNNSKHSYKIRLKALKDLQSIGYQTGTGVMIGTPFQTYDDIFRDIEFMYNFDIDMIGLGPYIEHKDTPLYQYKNKLLPIQERFELTLKTISLLRIIMPDINIASATALQAIDPMGREKALNIGANIIMPNVTPGMYRDSYNLYENKPCTDEEASDCISCLDMRIKMSGNEIGYGKWGDSKHYFKRRNQ